MNKTFFIYVGLALSVVFLIGSSQAQDAIKEEVPDYVFGRVSAVIDSGVVLESYNVEKDEYDQIEILVDDKTSYEEMGSLNDLTDEDYVEVFYTVYPDHLLAKRVIKDVLDENVNDDENMIEPEINAYEEGAAEPEGFASDGEDLNFLDNDTSKD